MKVENCSDISLQKKARSSVTLRSCRRNGKVECEVGEAEFEDDRVLAQYFVRSNGVTKAPALLPSKGAVNPRRFDRKLSSWHGDAVSLSQHNQLGDTKTLAVGTQQSDDGCMGHHENGQSPVEEEEGLAKEYVGNKKSKRSSNNEDDDFMTLDCLVAKRRNRKIGASVEVGKANGDSAMKVAEDDDCSTLNSLINSANKLFLSKAVVLGTPIKPRKCRSPIASGETNEAAGTDFEMVKDELGVESIEDDDCSTLVSLINSAKNGAKQLRFRTATKRSPVESCEVQEVKMIDVEKLEEDLPTKISKDGDCSTLDLRIVAAKGKTRPLYLKTGLKNSPIAADEAKKDARADPAKIKEDQAVKITEDEDCPRIDSPIIVAKERTKQSFSKLGVSYMPAASDKAQDVTTAGVEKIREDLETNIVNNDDFSSLNPLIIAAKEGSKQPLSKTEAKINPTTTDVEQEGKCTDLEKITEGLDVMIMEADYCSASDTVINARKEGTKHFSSETGDEGSPLASYDVPETLEKSNSSAKVGEISDVEESQGLKLLPVAVRASQSKTNGRSSSKPAESRRMVQKEKTTVMVDSDPGHESLAMSEIKLSHVFQSNGRVSKGRRTARKAKSIVKFEFLDSQSISRKLRKRKQIVTTYDGDLEWDALMGDAEGTGEGVDHSGKGKSKFSTESSSLDYKISGEVAAVAAGLRARAPGPTERVRFKDVLKRRGGLQEYIDCRNLVLSLWEKDVHHLLSIEDCGVSAVPEEGESPRVTLIRDIFEFLDYHGHINIGIAKKRPKPCTVESPVIENALDSSKLVSTPCSPTSVMFNDMSQEIHGNNLDSRKQSNEEITEVNVHALNLAREVEEIVLKCNNMLENNHVAVGNEEHSLYSSTVNGRKRTLEESETLLPSKKQRAVTEQLPTIVNVSGFESTEKGLSLEGLNSTSSGEGVFHDSEMQIVTNARDPQLGSDSDVQRISEPLNSATLNSCRSENWKAKSMKSETYVKFEDILELAHPPEIKDLGSVDSRCLSGEVNGIEAPYCLHRCDGQGDLVVNEGLREAENKLNISDYNQNNSDRQQHVIVVGAGPAGLAASRHMQRMNFKVTVLEARDRVGGRVYTDRRTFSAPVDLGASIITGVEADVTTERRADPSSLLCKQLGLQLTTLGGDCPLYDSVTGLKVPADVDEELEAEYNGLLDDTIVLVAKNGDTAMRMSLEEGLEKALKNRRMVQQCRPSKTDSQADCIGDSIQCQSIEGLEPNASIQSEGNSLKREEFNDAVSYQPLLLENSFSSSKASTDFCRTSLCGNLKADKERATNSVVSNPADINHISFNVEPSSEKSQGFQTGSLNLGELERRIMDWHFANLEYGCAAQLCEVSLPYWNQDDAYGGFGGPHCMIKKGYGTLMEALAQGLDLRLGQEVTEIEYMVSESRDKGNIDVPVKVKTRSGDEFVGDAVLVTVPLGCLKADSIKFVPSLPFWKLESIRRLGFGTLNKVVLEFPIAFWDDSVDYFGATAKNTESRGRCFMFWNLKRTTGAPILVALVVGKAALEDEKKEKSELVKHALSILCKLFGEEAVPEPKASAVTNWGCEQYSRGTYSYVAVGASGEDYDILGRPVGNCIFFAGEATCKEHPDTVGGAFMSGLREAIRIAGVLRNHEDLTLEPESLRGTQRQSESERNEVRDLDKRLAAVDLSTALLIEGTTLDGGQKPFTRADLLKDMFESAKTAAGRLLVAKEMLKERVAVVKSFAGTRAGLTILNTWILDSMGKDATQLLRHCVRLLLVVATDLRSIRRSGIGKTVKEKVYVHTSRDIRAIAGQLVRMWLDIFQREKSATGIPKPSAKASSVPRTHIDNATKAKFKKNKKICTFNTASPGVEKGSVTLTSTQGPGGQAISDKPNSLACPSVLDEQQKSEPSSAGLAEEGLQTSGAEQAISDMEISALAAAKAAQAAAKAFASAEAQLTSTPVLPEIVSFHKFAKREKLAVREATADLKRRKWPDLENPSISSTSMEKSLESVQCGLRKVNNWSLELTVSCVNLNSPDYGGEPISPGHEIPFSCIDSDTIYTVEGSSAGDKKQSIAVEVNTVSSAKKPPKLDAGQEFKISQDNCATVVPKSPVRERLQLKSETHSVAATGDFPDSETFFHTYEAPSFLDTSNKTSDMGEASNKVEIQSNKLRHTAGNGLCLPEVKKAVSDYVVHLLTPLYKTRKLQKDVFKTIVKKTVAKVMERDAPKDAVYDISEFLNCKRKNKIRALVDRFVEVHLSNFT